MGPGHVFRLILGIVYTSHKGYAAVEPQPMVDADVQGTTEISGHSRQYTWK